eukprot:365303-Chlamydomonas_euryale.AAC.13
MLQLGPESKHNIAESLDAVCVHICELAQEHARRQLTWPLLSRVAHPFGLLRALSQPPPDTSRVLLITSIAHLGATSTINSAPSTSVSPGASGSQRCAPPGRSRGFHPPRLNAREEGLLAPAKTRAKRFIKALQIFCAWVARSGRRGRGYEETLPLRLVAHIAGCIQERAEQTMDAFEQGAQPSQAPGEAQSPHMNNVMPDVEHACSDWTMVDSTDCASDRCAGRRDVPRGAGMQ